MSKTSRIVSLCLCCCVWLTGSAAHANGGHGKITESTPLGGFFLMKNNDIALIREDLRLDVRDESFDAVAQYDLRNDGESAEVLVGVPLCGLNQNVLRALAGRVKVTQGDTVYSCRLEEKPDSFSDVLFRPRDMVFSLSRKSVTNEFAWCVVSLKIPKGPAKFTLSYPGSLFFEAWHETDGPGIARSHGVLYYPLFPAGYWKGPLSTLDVLVTLSTDRPVIDTWPKGVKAKKRQLSWHFKNVDLLELREIQIVLAADKEYRDPDYFPTAEEWEPYCCETLGLRASSTLPRQGKHSYQPSLMLDGDLATAWCEGSKGDGVGEWIEIQIPESFYNQPSEEFYGHENQATKRKLIVNLAPGHTASQGAYRNNNRVRKVQWGACGSGDPIGKPIDLATQLYYKFAERLVRWPNYSLPDCVRLTILEVDPGEKYNDTCISEIRPRFVVSRSLNNE